METARLRRRFAIHVDICLTLNKHEKMASRNMGPLGIGSWNAAVLAPPNGWHMHILERVGMGLHCPEGALCCRTLLPLLLQQCRCLFQLFPRHLPLLLQKLCRK